MKNLSEYHKLSLFSQAVMKTFRLDFERSTGYNLVQIKALVYIINEYLSDKC